MTRLLPGAALLAWLAAVGASLAWNLERHREGTEEQVRTMAGVLAGQVEALWEWHRRVGGVWVPDPQGRDGETADGRSLVRLPAARLVSEVSRLSWRRGRGRFRPVALDPVRPEHAPDAWERVALERIAAGEVPAVGREGDRFRVVVPVRAGDDCVDCHADAAGRGFHGGLSVSLPAGPILREARAARRLIVALHAGMAVLGSFAILGVAAARAERMRAMRRHAAALEERNRELARLAATDPLTALWNRRAVMQRLDELREAARRRGETVAVLVADLDHFKAVNDTHGHAVGDDVLRAVARELRGLCRPDDVVGRIGGEEFLLALPGCTLLQGAQVAERARAAVRALRVATGEEGVHARVTLSVGVALVHPEDASAEVAVRHADAALYAAKAAGRDRVMVWDRDAPADPWRCQVGGGSVRPLPAAGEGGEG